MGAAGRRRLLTTAGAALTYATWDSGDKSSSFALSNGDLTGTSSADAAARATISCSGANRYFEITVDSDVGVSDTLIGLSVNTAAHTAWYNRVGNEAYAIYGRGGSLSIYTLPAGWATYTGTYQQGDVIGVAYRVTDGELYFAINNTWGNSGDPVARTNPAFTGLSSSGLYPSVRMVGASQAITADFGQSGFTYTPPTGFVGVY